MRLERGEGLAGVFLCTRGVDRYRPGVCRGRSWVSLGRSRSYIGLPPAKRSQLRPADFFRYVSVAGLQNKGFCWYFYFAAEAAGALLFILDLVPAGPSRKLSFVGFLSS